MLHPVAQSRSLYARRVQGKDERIVLGTFPEMSVEKARAAALKVKAEIAEGKNPSNERRKLRSEITFGELFSLFMERYSKKRKSSWQYDEREVNKFLSHWFNRKVSTITEQEVQTLHENIRDNNGLYQANRILERIQVMYNKGIEWGLDVANPAQGVKKYKEQSRDRFIQADELPYFWQALAEEENDVARDYIIISLLTGARKSNVLSMQWVDINLDRKEWRIPHTKNGEPHTIPLSPPAIAVLDQRRSVTNSAWVFPSARSRTGHLADPKKPWRRVLQRATIKLWLNNEKLAPHIHNVRTDLPENHSPAALFKAITKAANDQKYQSAYRINGYTHT